MTSSIPPLPDAPDTSQIERRIRALLTRYEEATPPASVADRVRERLAAEMAPSPQRARRLPSHIGAPGGAGGWARGALSLGLVAALIVGFVGIAWLRNGAHLGSGTHGSSSGQCVMVVGTDNRAKPCPPIDIKASVAVTESYADPTRTAVELRVSAPGARIPRDQTGAWAQPDSLQILGATLRDTHGRSYPVAAPLLPADHGVAGAFSYATGQDVAAGYYEFEPLSETDFGAPQTLRLRITGLRLIAERQYVMELAGPWVVIFQVTPQAGRAVSIHVAPQTHHGVTLQPLRLDIGPKPSVFDGFGGGERLILRISGLAPTTRPAHIAYLSTYFKYADGRVWDGRAAYTLQLEGQLPAAIMGVNLSPDAVVGPSGTLDLEVIFLSPPLPQLTGTQTLSLNQLALSVNPTNTVVTKAAKGPWVFQLPLG